MKIFFQTIFIITFTHALSAQTWETGIFLGGANYQGDMAPTLVLHETNPAIGIFLLRNFNQHFAGKVEFIHGRISGADSNFAHLQERNLSFFSPVTELNVHVELNFFPFAVGLRPRNHTPYAYAGLAAFVFNPKTEFEGENIRLRPLFNEGSENRYHLTQIAIPIGGGYKFTLNEKINASIYTGYRLLFTDYIDDVSTEYFPARHPVADPSYERVGRPGKQRGNSDLNDGYFFAGITIAYRIRDPICPYPQ